MRTENPGISVESLSVCLFLSSLDQCRVSLLFLTSLEKSEFQRIVPECGMSICQDAISNLAILVHPCESSQSGRIDFTQSSQRLGGLVLPNPPRLVEFVNLQLHLHKFVKLGGLVLD